MVVQEYVRILRFPLLLVTVNFLLSMVFSKFPEGIVSVLADIASTIVTIVAVCLAGWITMADSSRSLWTAAWMGVVVFFVELVVLGGLYVLLGPGTNGTGEGASSGTALIGVAISFSLLSPVALLLGASGGWFRKSRGHTEPPQFNGYF